MKYAAFDQEGNITGFYTPEIHSNIPSNTIEITDEQWQDCLSNQGQYKIINGQLVYSPPPEPTPEEIRQQQIDSLNNEIIPQFQMLRDSFLSAQLANNQQAISEITADYQALWQEYNSRMGAIQNG